MFLGEQARSSPRCTTSRTCGRWGGCARRSVDLLDDDDGTLALTGVGIPFTWIGFAGYVCKDAIIEGVAYASHRFGATYAFVCVTFAAGLTSFYSWRLVFMTFFGQRGDWAASLPAPPTPRP